MEAEDLHGRQSETNELSALELEVIERATALGVDLSATLMDRTADAEDVAWSSNDWCLSKTEPIRAGDVVVHRQGSAGEEVLMIRRQHLPFASCLALPGGMNDRGESLYETADREMAEEVGLRPLQSWERRELGERVATDWDPRFVSVHVAALAYRVSSDAEAFAGDDAKEALWVPVDELAHGKYALAFGHAEWLRAAFERDVDQASRFRVLSEASLLRNRRIIRQVNEVRRQKGAQEIEISST